VTKEVFGGQHIDSQNPLTKERKHQINSYFKDIISTVNESDELFWTCRNKNKTSAKNQR
jgi:hypothetical protein